MASWFGVFTFELSALSPLDAQFFLASKCSSTICFQPSVLTRFKTILFAVGTIHLLYFLSCKAVLQSKLATLLTRLDIDSRVYSSMLSWFFLTMVSLLFLKKNVLEELSVPDLMFCRCYHTIVSLSTTCT